MTNKVIAMQWETFINKHIHTAQHMHTDVSMGPVQRKPIMAANCSP